MTIGGIEQLTPFPGDVQLEDYGKHDRMFALYFRTWMEEPTLIHAVIDDIVPYRYPAPNASPGFASLITEKTDDNRTGSFNGVDINNPALIPARVMLQMGDEDFRAAWIASGAPAWQGELEMLEAALEDKVAEGSLGWPLSDEVHDDIYGHRHPARAREHIRIVPGSHHGKVAKISPDNMYDDTPEDSFSSI